uniref:Uncharacterized protein n=1 Tax=Candidatus Methanophagaceae archaeon ANME-1 ERB6 TaxID=2759912 RepID=A0A7G9YYT2_9EURY|nr:hypothetical protein GZ26D8_16 [uncultured archaeon GZfos26D8]QNO53166.1 hypothetical protein NDOAJMFA_00016 [Methanosarcinales archaeon ANME-1 ERB6]
MKLMKLKWDHIKIGIYGLLGGLAVVVDKMFGHISTMIGLPLTILIVVLSISVIVIVMDRIKNKYQPDLQNILGKILNSCAKDPLKLKITTIRNFLDKTKEESLIMGDKVHILTNSLKTYDLTAPAVKVIADNLRDGVHYIYYLSPKKYPVLIAEKDKFVDLILKEREDLNKDHINSNLIFYTIDEKCLYNFATVTKKGATEGYWYVATLSPEESSPNLTILTLSEDDTNELVKAFTRLRDSSKRITALEKGLGNQ